MTADILRGSRVVSNVFLLAAGLGLSISGNITAHGGYLLTMTDLGSISGPALANPVEAGPLSADFVTYLLTLKSDDGSTVRAVDVDLRGVFQQEWKWDGGSGAYAPSASGASMTGRDSHLLPSADALFAVSASEDNNVFPTSIDLDAPEVSDVGLGSRLAGVWASPGISKYSMDLAYLVLPRGYESQLEYKIVVANDLGETHSFYQGASFPEPPPPPPVVTLPDPAPVELPGETPPASWPTPPIAETPPIDDPPETDPTEIEIPPIVTAPDIGNTVILQPWDPIVSQIELLNGSAIRPLILTRYPEGAWYESLGTIDPESVVPIETYNLESYVSLANYFSACDSTSTPLAYFTNAASFGDFDSTAVSVPEPTTWLLLVLGVAALNCRRR